MVTAIPIHSRAKRGCASQSQCFQSRSEGLYYLSYGYTAQCAGRPKLLVAKWLRERVRRRGQEMHSFFSSSVGYIARA